MPLPEAPSASCNEGLLPPQAASHHQHAAGMAKLGEFVEFGGKEGTMPTSLADKDEEWLNDRVDYRGDSSCGGAGEALGHNLKMKKTEEPRRSKNDSVSLRLVSLLEMQEKLDVMKKERAA